MKFSFDPIVETAGELKKLTVRLAEEGTTFLRSTFGSIPLFASVKPRLEGSDFGADEQHYFLVPFRPAPEQYALFSVRVLPDGAGPENDLPKRRIFHLPGTGTQEALEKLLTAQLSEEAAAGLDQDTPFADRLDQIADEIDQKSNLVTGGLLLIGGAVAVANPLVGAAIAAKALISSLGSKIGSKLTGYFTEKMRSWSKKRVEDQAQKEAEQELKKLKPEVVTNPLLALLEEALATPEAGHDPALDPKNLDSDIAESRDISLAAEAIWTCYEPALKSKTVRAETRLHDADLDWIESLPGRIRERNTG